jgi:hypothetical protein
VTPSNETEMKDYIVAYFEHSLPATEDVGVYERLVRPDQDEDQAAFFLQTGDDKVFGVYVMEEYDLDNALLINGDEIRPPRGSDQERLLETNWAGAQLR